MTRREFKGWFDLSPEELKEAVLGLKKESLRETDEYLIRDRVSKFEKDSLLSSEEATSLKQYLDSLREKKS